MKYVLFVQCRQCSADLVIKDDLPEPKPDDPPPRHSPQQVTCEDCGFSAVYKVAEMQLGEMEPPPHS